MGSTSVTYGGNSNNNSASDINDPAEQVLVTVPGGSVIGVSVDNGSVERSMVTSLTLTFASTITSGEIPQTLSLMTLTRASGSLSVGLAGTFVNSNTLEVTFTGSSIIGGSLADGRYTFTYGNTTLLAAGQQGDTNESLYLWRLFGNLYGTASVTAADETAFLAAYNTRKGMSNYSVYFDYNNGGEIINSDETQFLQRYGTSI